MIPVERRPASPHSVSFLFAMLYPMYQTSHMLFAPAYTYIISHHLFHLILAYNFEQIDIGPLAFHHLFLFMSFIIVVSQLRMGVHGYPFGNASCSAAQDFVLARRGNTL